ncbi:hypothetical protein E2C01_076325 [Portunus trituberculatus]|uniref:Uncharacterized protein n=1 Tax=Portunus trituberculatus TaxID=210409 RepID=A0A5B7INA1_PORTR|nr:hypothetical protein [Portunus trituberculatus]
MVPLYHGGARYNNESVLCNLA